MRRVVSPCKGSGMLTGFVQLTADAREGQGEGLPEIKACDTREHNMALDCRTPARSTISPLLFVNLMI